MSLGRRSLTRKAGRANLHAVLTPTALPPHTLRSKHRCAGGPAPAITGALVHRRRARGSHSRSHDYRSLLLCCHPNVATKTAAKRVPAAGRPPIVKACEPGHGERPLARRPGFQKFVHALYCTVQCNTSVRMPLPHGQPGSKLPIAACMHRATSAGARACITSCYIMLHAQRAT